ncbi:MAG: stage III sporulation protein AE [Oscillospiraceae bacterium]|nr:stage III sporulation protein AE [Oscillospiraceae bacterium]
MKRVLCLLFAIVLLSFSVDAEDESMYRKQLDAIGADELLDAVPEGADEFELKSDLSFNEGLSVVLDKLLRGIKGIFSAGLRCVAAVITVSFVCNCVSALTLPADNFAVQTSISLVGAIAVTAAAAQSITGVIGMGKELISNVDLFSKSLLPTLAAVEAASGAPGGAIARTTATVFFSDLLISLINYALMPLVYVNIFAATANAAAPNSALRKISDLSVRVVSSTLKLTLGAFVSYITVTGVISGSVDTAGIKTAKFAIGGAVPVVGGIISDAAETVMAGAALIKSTVGVFGMLVILSACAVPFLTLAVNYFLFKFASVCTSPITGESISGLAERLGQSFGLVLAMSASCVTVIFIAIVAAMKSAGVG